MFLGAAGTGGRHILAYLPVTHLLFPKAKHFCLTKSTGLTVQASVRGNYLCYTKFIQIIQIYTIYTNFVIQNLLNS